MKIDANQKKKLKDFLVKKMKEDSEGRVVIEIPYLLSENDLEQFRRVFPQFKDKQLMIDVRPELLGGFIIRHGSTIIDASVTSEVNNLVAHLGN